MKGLYNPKDFTREIQLSKDYRDDFRRDYARLVHSPSFRRLKCKTQLFPELESDFFRNRLSHSIEVAQIAKSIAIKLNLEEKELARNPINLDVIEFAGLAHDLGHPPFGHTGEKVLDAYMKRFGGFEGNAQTLRILSRLEKKQKRNGSNDFGYNEKTRVDGRLGLNLTYRVLASILKYDKLIKSDRKKGDPLIKGYYSSEKDLVRKIKMNVLGGKYPGKFKTLECSIMDIADDIAYSTYDLEDCFKAKFSSPFDFLNLEDETIKKIIKEKFKPKGIALSVAGFKDYMAQAFFMIFSDGFFDLYDYVGKTKAIKDINELARKYINGCISGYSVSKNICENGYERINVTSKFVDKFINGIEFRYNKKYPPLSRVILDKKTKVLVEILKQYTYEIVINSPMLKIPTYRGEEIVGKLFEIISRNSQLLPNDFRKIYNFEKTEKERKRVICDFISGMTDRYAIEFYGRLFSETPETIFKPIY